MITIDNLAFSYGSVPVLKNISMQLEEGKIYGLLGENGVGKTTLLTLLCGLKKVSSGRIRTDGRDPYSREADFLADQFYLADEVAPLNMTAVDFAAEEAAEELPIEEELLMEAPKAARGSADFAAAAQAVPEANAAPTEGAAEQMMMDYAALPASPVCDLSGTLRFAELLETLGGEKVTLPLERLGEEPALIVRCADGELSLFDYEGALYYYDPVGETLMRTPLSREDVYDLGTKPAP